MFAAQYWGVKDLRGMRRVLGIAACFCLGLSLSFLLGALLVPQTIIRLFNQEPSVVAEAVDYIRIAAFSYPAIALTLLLSTFLRNIEKVRIPMYVSLFRVCLHH